MMDAVFDDGPGSGNLRSGRGRSVNVDPFASIRIPYAFSYGMFFSRDEVSPPHVDSDEGKGEDEGGRIRTVGTS